ncbi:MAG: DEAD/DEAH box helicase family protein [Herbaspirillum sp.]|uniref:DEAD/DEAH box helicase family protein n=1 Tax=Herbaspirillum sp. TaxID=1890675 RepID=UPI00258E4CDF|nr:DEAD/DEAH box helicase family protein [Herbaspirillum sp.]MCP3658114.1 DEAD/DEAH box helicase family protein [Herbaspirillum sp.]
MQNIMKETPSALEVLNNDAQFLTGFGQRDTHAITLADGRPNTSLKAGTPYKTISWGDVIALAQSPRSAPKHRAQFVIPSTYAESDGRAHEVQRARGKFGFLAVDVDSGSPSMAQIETALGEVLGQCEALIYTSSGATPDRMKWRVLIPLERALAGADYADTQSAFFDLLGAQGIEADRALERPGQPVFLPNVPPDRRGDDGAPVFYRWKHIRAPRLCLIGSPIEGLRERKRADDARAKAEAEAAREQRALIRAQHVAATGDDFEPIAHFNATHTIADLLARYCYARGPKNNWRSPFQTSGSFATQDRGDHWVSVSGSDAAAGLGRDSKGGFRSGDAFDLFAFFEHGGDKRAAVRAYAQEVRPQKPPERHRAPLPLPALPSVTEARKAVQGALGAFWKEAQEGDRFHVLKVPTGVGKTRALIELIGRVIRELRAKGDMRAVMIYAPDHKLNDQILRDFERYAPWVTVMVRRGRPADNPDRPGETMCRNLPAVERAQSFVLDVSKTVCRGCPFAGDCAYLASQKRQADVYILPHAALGNKPPATVKEFAQGIAFVAIDESPDMIARAGTVAVAALDGMRATQTAGEWETERSALAREADLRAWRGQLAKLIAENGEGPIEADRVELTFTIDDLRAAAKAEWGRKIDDPDRPEDDLAQNKTIKRMARIWRELADMLEEGRPRTARLVVFNDAEAGLSVRVKALKELHKDIARAPRILLDATADRRVTEAALGAVDTWREVQADAPHMRIAQDAEQSLSKSMMQADLEGKGSDTARKAAENNRQKLIQLIRKRWAKFGRQAGAVITYKATADAIRPHVPEGVTVMHFGAVRGRNDVENVRWLLIAGRMQPSHYDSITMAETLTGLPVEGGFAQIEGQRRWRDDRGEWTETTQARGFTDPMGQACLEAVRDADLMQALGRGRGVNRTEADPLDVLVIGDGFLSVPVHNAAGAWADMTRRNVIEEQLGQGGIAYAGAAAAFTAYGTRLFTSHDAVKKALQRLGDIPLIDTYREMSPSPMALVRLKRSKRAPDWTEALIDLAQHPDPRAGIEAQLGALAAFEVIDAPTQSLEREVPLTMGSHATPSKQGKQLSSVQENPAPKATMQAKLIVLPDAEQIDSPLIRDRIAQPDEKPRRRNRPVGFWQVIAGQPFLIWTRRTGQDLAALIDRQPPRLAYAGAT